MMTLLDRIREFQKETGLADFTVGRVLAKNGRLIERLENSRRIWPETEDLILRNMKVELDKRTRRGEASK